MSTTTINRAAVPTLSISASSKIAPKVTHSLALLLQPIGNAPAAVALEARADIASKVVTISEIVKRELSKAGKKWWGYCVVETREASKKVVEAVEVDEGGFREMEEKRSRRRESWCTVYIALEKIAGMEAFGETTSG